MKPTLARSQAEIDGSEVNVHIFQPGGYFVRTQTSALGMYAALMPTGPTEIYFTKELRTTRNLSIEVRDNIQVGARAADVA